MKIIVTLILLISFSVFADSRVRRAIVTKDEIVTVRTAMGIATIVQVPDRPNSVVVGDQDAFKVEYLDNAITIKPLHGSAKSNLYVYTDWRRWNVQLVTGSESVAEYVVYLENKKLGEKSVNGITWTSFKNYLTNDFVKLETKRLGKTKDGVLIIEFQVTGKTKETLKPEWIWLTQNGEARPIQQLFLSELEISGKNPIQGVLQIQKEDFDSFIPIKIEFRRGKTSFLTLPKVNLWK